MDKWKRVYFFSWLVSIFINAFKNPQKFSFKKILVIRLDEIGDMVTSLPALDVLKKKYPDAEITIWCTPLTAQLLQYNKAIRRIVFSEKELSEKYDLIVDLRGNFRTLWFALKQFPKYRLDRGTVRFRNKFFLKQHPHEVFTNLQVLEPLAGKNTDDISLHLETGTENKQAAQKFLNENSIGKFAIFHSGARKVLRRLPGEKFAQLGKYLRTNLRLEIIFVGTNDELNEIKEIQQMMNFPTFAFCGFSLLDFAALCAKAEMMIGNESGPMHIAAAMNIPVVGLFGPGEPHTFSPFGKKATFIHHKLECNPCGQVVCVHPENTCMNRIIVDEIVDKIKRVTA